MCICRPSIILALFLAATLQLITNHVSCQPISPTFSYVYCRSELFGNYTANSTYESNLKTVISELAAHASIVPFYDTSVGIGSDTVHGQYYCRGDVSPAFCGECISAASLFALNCSNARAAIIWYNECTLRYKNESMFGVTEVAPTLSTYSLRNLSDPETLSPVLNETLTQLIQQAVSMSGSNSSVKYFATGARELSAFETAYFLVQCSPDLNDTQCEFCLLHAYDRMQTCCGEWPLSIYTSPPSCQVDYDTRGIFYFTSIGPAPPPLSSSSPPPPHVGSKPPPSPQGTVFQFSPPPSNHGGSAKTRNSDSVKLGITSAIAILVFVTLRFNP